MTGSEERLVDFMNGTNKQFVIPVYQRNYDWRLENCRQLFSDLEKIIRFDRKSHFFGSVVSVYNPNGKLMEFMIIDGQQRLTTVSLLLLAICKLVEEGKMAAEDEDFAEDIYDAYLIEKRHKENKRMRLKPSKDDQAAFARLFGDSDEFLQDSRVTANYEYFYSQIQKSGFTVEQLYEAVCRLEIIHIKLNPEYDDPQLVFESLNSTGLALNEGDKIRNLILMGLKTQKQEEFYENYWEKIEQCTGGDVSDFIRDYLSVKLRNIPSKDRVYAVFKAYREEHERELDTEALLTELLRYAKWYQILLKANTNNQNLNRCIDRLNRLETTVTRPFFLEVLRIYSEGALSLDGVEEIFRYTENYLYRRTICDLPTNALSKIFLLLHREITRYENNTEQYVEKFKYALLSKKERGRFPDDAEFAAAFSERQMYLMNSKNKIYTLERLNNYNTLEEQDIYAHCSKDCEHPYTIEHIMPQNLSPSWIRDLGEDYIQIHEQWLHRIANLTLTAYNGKYSNSSFHEKKTTANGFLQSGIRLNTDIAQQEKWTLAELEARDRKLTAVALDLWDYPAAGFKPEKKPLETCTLEDEEELTGRHVVKYSFRNTEQLAASWAAVFQQVIKILYEEDSAIIKKLALSSEPGLAQHFGTKASEFNNSAEIADGIVVWSNTSTQSKMSVLLRLFELYGEKPENLVFYLKEEEEEEDGSRFRLRRRYWTYALEVLQSVHVESGCYSKVNPTRDNWLNGFFGIGGFYVCAVANYDHARAELVMQRSVEAENKEAFDKIHAHREEIEGKLGRELIWDRGEEKKSSKVYVVLNGVSIENEDDWPEMARFQAEWTKKFYDVLVPYFS